LGAIKSSFKKPWFDRLTMTILLIVTLSLSKGDKGMTKVIVRQAHHDSMMLKILSPSAAKIFSGLHTR
jgi:hypothetical protein